MDDDVSKKPFTRYLPLLFFAFSFAEKTTFLLNAYNPVCYQPFFDIGSSLFKESLKGPGCFQRST